jgi:hypothetical protein
MPRRVIVIRDVADSTHDSAFSSVSFLEFEKSASELVEDDVGGLLGDRVDSDLGV